MRPETLPAEVKPSKHSRRYVGVHLGNGEHVAFGHSVTVSCTETPAWRRKDRRRAANKRARAARKANRP